MEENLIGNDTAVKPVLYGHFIVRLLAFIVDFILLNFAGNFVAYLLYGNSRLQYLGNPANINELLKFISDHRNYFELNLIIAVSYYALLESSKYQATIGKMIMRLKVGDMDGNRISLPRALARYFSKVVSSMTIGIGYLMIFWDPKRQGLHDKICKTTVRMNLIIIKKVVK